MKKDSYNIQGATLSKKTITFEVNVFVEKDTATDLGVLDRFFDMREIDKDTSIVWISKNGGKARKVYTEYNPDHKTWYFSGILP